MVFDRLAGWLAPTHRRLKFVGGGALAVASLPQAAELLSAGHVDICVCVFTLCIHLTHAHCIPMALCGEVTDTPPLHLDSLACAIVCQQTAHNVPHHFQLLPCITAHHAAQPATNWLQATMQGTKTCLLARSTHVVHSSAYADG